MLTLVDTSSWVQSIRPNGDKATKLRVAELLEAGNAVWCDIVRLELWNGAGDSREKKILRELESSLPLLPINQPVWEEAIGLAISVHGRGVSVPSTDLLIFACATVNQVRLEFFDKHFQLLSRFS